MEYETQLAAPADIPCILAELVVNDTQLMNSTYPASRVGLREL